MKTRSLRCVQRGGVEGRVVDERVGVRGGGSGKERRRKSRSNWEKKGEINRKVEIKKGEIEEEGWKRK